MGSHLKCLGLSCVLLSSCQEVFLPLSLSPSPLLPLSLSLSFYVSPCLSNPLSVSFSVSPNPSLSLPVCLSVSLLSKYLSLPVCLPVLVSISVSLCLSLCIFFSLHLKIFHYSLHKTFRTAGNVGLLSFLESSHHLLLFSQPLPSLCLLCSFRKDLLLVHWCPLNHLRCRTPCLPLLGSSLFLFHTNCRVAIPRP